MNVTQLFQCLIAKRMTCICLCKNRAQLFNMDLRPALEESGQIVA